MGWPRAYSLCIPLAYGDAPPGYLEYVSGGTNIRVEAGAFEFKDAGGRVRFPACGGDYEFADGFAEFTLAEFDTGQHLVVYSRDSGSAWHEIDLDLAAGSFEVTGSAEGPVGSGTVPIAAGDRFRIETQGTLLRLQRAPGGVGTPATIAGGQFTVGAGSGTFGVEFSGAGGNLARITGWRMGPLATIAPRVYTPSSRLYVLHSLFDPGKSPLQGQLHDALWANGWAGPSGWVRNQTLPIIQRGYDHLKFWSLCNNAVPGEGVRIGEYGWGDPHVATMTGLRFHDVMRNATRAAWDDVPADARMKDGFLTAMSEIAPLCRDLVFYLSPPPQGLGGATAWATTDAAFAEWDEELDLLGASKWHDGSGGVDRTRAGSTVLRAYDNWLLRQRMAGRGGTLGMEAHAELANGYMAPSFEAPFTAGGVQVGPLYTDVVSPYDGNPAGTTIFAKVIAAATRGDYYGPWRVPAMRHFAVMDGSVAKATRLSETARITRMGKRFGVILETFDLTPDEDRTVQRFGKTWPGAGRSFMDLGATVRGRPRR